MYADNVSFDGTKRGAPVTADGQLLIGSTASPHIKVGSLGSGSNIVITPGSGSISVATSLTPTFTSATINNSPIATTDAVNKAYVDAIAAGFDFKNTTLAGTVAPLTASYFNGVAGVGATLTNTGALAAFSVDGQSPAQFSRILVKDQASSFENGIYRLTVVGDGATAWILERTSDYDTSAEMIEGSIIPVQSGTVNVDTLWLQNTIVVNVGVDAVGYQKFQSAPIVTTQHAILIGDVNNKIANLGPLTDGQIIVGKTGSDSSLTVPTGSNGVVVTPGAGTLAFSGDLASATEVKVGTSTTKLLTPSTFATYMNDLEFTGFQSWASGGPFFNDTTLGTFTVLVGGTGYIRGKLITWTGPQSFVGMTAGNTYYIYMDNTGTIGAATTRTDALYTDNIVLFECLRDSTPVTNNQVTVKENHPYNYPATVANYEHDNIGVLIENNQNGADITLNGTQGIQINGADVLSDHGLETIIPDSGGAAVTFNKKYTLASGKWALQNSTNTFTGFWNNAGTPTALTAGRFAVYTLYVSKDNLNSATPVYFAVLDTSQYASQAAATTAISNGTTAKISNELAQLELAQLGYIIYRQSTAAITSVIISKKTLTSQTSTAGTNQASLVNTDVTNFNGWLSSSDTNVQSALDTLDDSQRCTATAISATLVINQGFVTTDAGLATLTLPTTAKVGDTIEVVGQGAGGWLIAQNANQMIHFNSATTTTGGGGSLASTVRYNCVKLMCVVANLEFTVTSSEGNLTLV